MLHECRESPLERSESGLGSRAAGAGLALWPAESEWAEKPPFEKGGNPDWHQVGRQAATPFLQQALQSWGRKSRERLLFLRFHEVPSGKRAKVELKKDRNRVRKSFRCCELLPDLPERGLQSTR
jgi:hypothetical protein